LLEASYPPTQSRYYNLSQILTIESENEFDVIMLGDRSEGKIVGMIGKTRNGFVFYPEYDSEREYAPTETYAETFINAFIEIANDPALAHEFAILSGRKALSDTELF
jgi:hypothetical protein